MPSVTSICCIGAGYVGGPTMAVIADRCPGIEVTVVDLNAERIAAWNDPDLSRLPVYELGLDAVVGSCRGRNLHFSTGVEAAFAAADLVYLCGYHGLHEVAAYWQQQRIARLVVNRLFGTVSGKRIGVLGFAFKADTNDTRESPAIRICKVLLEEGAQLAIYDPKVPVAQIARDLGQPELPAEASERQALSGEGSWRATASAFEAVAKADAALILTEWGEFSQLDWQALAAGMRQPAWVFDARAVADAAAVRGAGLHLWSVGAGV